MSQVRFLEGAEFYLRCHFQTGSGAHPTRIWWITRTFPPGLKWLEHKFDHSPSSSAKIKMCGALLPLPILSFMEWYVGTGTTYLFLNCGLLGFCAIYSSGFPTFSGEHATSLDFNHEYPGSMFLRNVFNYTTRVLHPDVTVQKTTI